MKKHNQPLSPKHRRNEIALLLVSGMLKAKSAIKPLSEKLSDSSQKALDVVPKTGLSVDIE
jgi:hypothetical protein